MLTVKQAAERACVSEDLIYQWCADGTLAHYRLGARGRRGKIAIAEADLDAALASFRVSKPVPKRTTAPAPPTSSFKHLKLR